MLKSYLKRNREKKILDQKKNGETITFNLNCCFLQIIEISYIEIVVCVYTHGS
jgi:hypothetical protein